MFAWYVYIYTLENIYHVLPLTTQKCSEHESKCTQFMYMFTEHILIQNYDCETKIEKPRFGVECIMFCFLATSAIVSESGGSFRTIV